MTLKKEKNYLQILQMKQKIKIKQNLMLELEL